MNSYKCCNNSSLEGNQILSQLSLLKLLADRNRLRILCILNSNSHTVSEIIEHLEQSQSLVSHHLIDLKKMKLVSNKKEGRAMIYSLSAKGSAVLKLLKILSRKT